MRQQLLTVNFLVIVGCSPGAGLVIDMPATDTWTGGYGTSEGGETGDEGGGTGLPPGPPVPPDPTGSTMTSATSATSATTADPTTAEGGEEGGSPDGVPALMIPAQAPGWRWHTGAAPAGDWRANGFDDSAWSSGQAPLLTGAPLPATDSVIRLRYAFEIGGDPSGVAGLMMYVRRDDAATIFLNGQEVARSGLPIGAWGEGLKADGGASGSDGERYFRAVIPADALQTGGNVVAVALHGHAGDPDRAFDMQLEVLDLGREPTDRMSVQVRTHTYGGEYSDDHVAAIWIEKGGAFVKSLAVYGSERRDNLVAWNDAADGNTVDAMTGATRGRHTTHVVSWNLTDHAGVAAGPGAYTLRVEFTEDDSNSGAPKGPTVAVPFELGGGTKVVSVVADQRFRDWLVIAP